MEYTLVLQSHEDYNIIKKLLKAFEGASIRPKNESYTIYDALDEAHTVKVVGPFQTKEDLMESLLS